MTEDYDKYSNYYVDKGQKKEIVFYANHDYIMEKDLWKSFHDRKIMKLYQRTETQTETEKPKQLWHWKSWLQRWELTPFFYHPFKKKSHEKIKTNVYDH